MMELLDPVRDWLGGAGQWMDWVWAIAWGFAGALLSHLLWWGRNSRLAERERKVTQSLATLDSRQREIRKLSEDIARREKALGTMEENLKAQTEQLKPQIEQVRNWLDQALQGSFGGFDTKELRVGTGAESRPEGVSTGKQAIS